MKVAQITLKSMDENIVFLIPMELMHWIEDQSLEDSDVKVQIPKHLIDELNTVWPINKNFNAFFEIDNSAINDAMIHLSTQLECVEEEDDVGEKAKTNYSICEEYEGMMY